MSRGLTFFMEDRPAISWPALVICAVVKLYQWTVSPFLVWLCGPGSGCRFEPTCSRYMTEAVTVHGAFRGIWLGLKRLARCHPWGGCGCDPVPQVIDMAAKSKHQPTN
jgi:putative membrane protein insertion efficiency factor